MGGPGLGGPRGRIEEILKPVFSSDGGWAFRRSSAHRVWHSVVSPAASVPAAEGGVRGEGHPQPQLCAAGACAFESPSRTVFCRYQRLRPGLRGSPAQPMPWAPDPLWLFQGQEAGPPRTRPLRFRGVASGEAVVYGRRGLIRSQAPPRRQNAR